MDMLLRCVVIISVASSSPAASQEREFKERAGRIGLAFVRDIPLPGSASRLDYQSIDESARRLYIAHLGADQVIVVDIDALAVVGSIPGVARPHGILALPELGQVVVSATGNDQVDMIDARTMKIAATIDGGHYPDGLACDPKSKRVFVSDETGRTVAVIDAVARRLVKKISMRSEVGNTHYDPVSGLIYSAAQSVDELVEIDPGNLEITGRYKLPGCKGPHGFCIDPATHYAFITGQENASYVVFDLTGKKIVATGSVGSDPDVLALDTTLHRLYVAAESGIVSVFDVRPGHVTKVGESFFAPDAHTVSVDEKTHYVYFPLREIGGKPVLRVMKPRSGM